MTEIVADFKIMLTFINGYTYTYKIRKHVSHQTKEVKVVALSKYLHTLPDLTSFLFENNKLKRLEICSEGQGFSERECKQIQVVNMITGETESIMPSVSFEQHPGILGKPCNSNKSVAEFIDEFNNIYDENTQDIEEDVYKFHDELSRYKFNICTIKENLDDTKSLLEEEIRKNKNLSLEVQEMKNTIQMLIRDVAYLKQIAPMIQL